MLDTAQRLPIARLDDLGSLHARVLDALVDLVRARQLQPVLAPFQHRTLVERDDWKLLVLGPFEFVGVIIVRIRWLILAVLFQQRDALVLARVLLHDVPEYDPFLLVLMACDPQLLEVDFWDLDISSRASF